jgi:hypothetical protein
VPGEGGIDRIDVDRQQVAALPSALRLRPRPHRCRGGDLVDLVDARAVVRREARLLAVPGARADPDLVEADPDEAFWSACRKGVPWWCHRPRASRRWYEMRVVGTTATGLYAGGVSAGKVMLWSLPTRNASRFRHHAGDPPDDLR